MSDEEKQGSSGLSRRKFLRGVGTGLVGASVALPAKGLVTPEKAEAAPAGSHALGPGPASLKLNVNGKDVTVNVEPRDTLADVLRNHLDLTGAKVEGCNRGGCGACTVMLDGKTVYSCMTLAVDAAGKKVVTVEGLPGGENHPLVKAFVKYDALQCGYCTPGFVVSGAAAIMQKKNMTTEDVKQGVCGNICRCGTYMGVFAAIAEASKGGG
jgi:aerobic-type carbon monoxide dehydrogenase small subunit (CoxS/CutS family)